VYTVFGGKAVPLGHDHPLLGLLEGQPQRIGEAGLTTGLTRVNRRSCPGGAKIRRDGDQHRAVGIAVRSLSGPALPLGVCPDSLGGYAQAGGRLGVCFSAVTEWVVMSGLLTRGHDRRSPSGHAAERLQDRFEPHHAPFSAAHSHSPPHRPVVSQSWWKLGVAASLAG
jgi:hypothetical protein